MKIALLFKEGVGEQLKNKLIGIKDNLDIDCYSSMQSLVGVSTKRNIVYDRVIFVANTCNENDIQMMSKWWKSVSDKTELVLIGRKNGADDEIVDNFINKFRSPLVAIMMIDKPTVNLIAEAVKQKTLELNQSYGKGAMVSVEVDRSYEYQPEPEVKEKTAEEQPQQSKKKKGFMSMLFGDRSKPEPQQQVQAQNTEPTVEEQYDEPNEQYEEPVEQYEEPTEQYEESVEQYEEPMEQYEESTESYEEPVFEESVQETDETVQENWGSDSEESFENEWQTEEPVSEDSVFDNTVDSSEEFGAVFENESSPLEENEEVGSIFDEQQEEEITEVDEDFVSFGDTESTEEFSNEDETEDTFENFEVTQPIQSSVRRERVEVKPVEVDEVDEDFSMGFSEDFSEEPVSQDTNEVEEVDVSMSEVDLASAEQAYREANKAKNTVVKEVVKEVVVEKVVEKEVVKEVHKGHSVLSSVLSGRQHKVIIVTGDRCTGITSTALTLAELFAKSVEVLYFDCDVDNHGLMSYIDYDAFKDYEDSHMQGVKLCKSSRNFNSCVCSLAHNIDFLTTDYSCDVTDEEIEVAQGVVAENSSKYGVVIVDCPVDKLSSIPDLIMLGVTIICVEGSKRGLMNMLCRLESSTLSVRYKRSMASKGIMLLTKCSKQVDVPKLIKYIQNIFVPDGVDWFSMRIRAHNGGKMSEKLLNEILEQ